MTMAIKAFQKILLISFCFASPLSVANSDWEQKLTGLIQQNLGNASIGFNIQDLKTGNTLYEIHSQENFYPASNTKLFTAAAALKFFGANFQYQTSIHANSEKIKEGTLNDNLYIIFRGDPSFSTTDLLILLKQVKEKGITQIKGNIIIDDTAFIGPSYAPGWTMDSLPWYFSAPITTIIVNENKVRFKIHKAEKLNDLIKIEQSDQLPALKTNIQVKAVTFEESENSCQLHAKVENNAISLSGCWPIEKTPSSIELALDNPREMTKILLVQFLEQAGIKLSGKITFQQSPKQVPVLLIKRSPPLKNLLIKVLADSNNIYTESLTKALGLAYLGQGSFQIGIKAIQEILMKDTLIDFSKVHMSDGSGQSRYNLVSPQIITKLLQHMYHDPGFTDYYAALSTSGKNGTLAMRMKQPEMAGKIVAKTGSAIGSSALSGYLTTQNGHQYVFSLIINQSILNSNSLKAFEDKLCQFLVQEPWSTPPPAPLAPITTTS